MMEMLCDCMLLLQRLPRVAAQSECTNHILRETNTTLKEISDRVRAVANGQTEFERVHENNTNKASETALAWQKEHEDQDGTLKYQDEKDSTKIWCGKDGGNEEQAEVDGP